VDPSGGKGLPLGEVFDQALLRAGAAGALRLAMKVERRAPRAQGITVSFSAAAFVMDLMKRALVFMVCALNMRFLSGRLVPLIED
jgi:hypothetical protein